MADINPTPIGVTHAQFMQAKGDLFNEVQFSPGLRAKLLEIAVYVAETEKTVEQQREVLVLDDEIFNTPHEEIAVLVEVLKVLKTGGPVKACIAAAVKVLEDAGVKLPDEPDEELPDENS